MVLIKGLILLSYVGESKFKSWLIQTKNVHSFAQSLYMAVMVQCLKTVHCNYIGSLLVCKMHRYRRHSESIRCI
jgi:hypothetical protein